VLPRHLLEINYSGHVYDFVIRFECHEVHVYKDQTIRLEFMIHKASAAPFNKVLTDAHIPLPKQPIRPSLAHFGTIDTAAHPIQQRCSFGRVALRLHSLRRALLGRCGARALVL
jgi:hypothetical protein